MRFKELKNHADVAAAETGALSVAKTGKLVAVEGDGAAVRRIYAADKVQQGGLAAAAASKDSEEVSAAYLQAHVVQYNALLSVVEIGLA